MTKKTRVVEKSYLETDDMPSQAEFIDIVDSSPNIIDDGIMIGGDTAITAFNGGGLANATLLVNSVNKVSTCVAGGDSIKLPVAVAGNILIVHNDTATSCDLFPNAGQEIMSLGVDTAQAIAAGECFMYASSGINWSGGKLA